MDSSEVPPWRYLQYIPAKMIGKPLKSLFEEGSPSGKAAMKRLGTNGATNDQVLQILCKTMSISEWTHFETFCTDLIESNNTKINIWQKFHVTAPWQLLWRLPFFPFVLEKQTLKHQSRNFTDFSLSRYFQMQSYRKWQPEKWLVITAIECSWCETCKRCFV